MLQNEKSVPKVFADKAQKKVKSYLMKLNDKETGEVNLSRHLDTQQYDINKYTEMYAQQIYRPVISNVGTIRDNARSSLTESNSYVNPYIKKNNFITSSPVKITRPLRKN